MNKPAIARLALGVVTPAVIAAVGFGPLALWNDRLPSRLATHWGLSGPPNGSMSKGAFAGFVGVFVLAAAIGLAALAVVRRVDNGARPMVTAVVASVGAIMAGASFSTCAVNRDLSDWHDASSPNAAMIAAVVAGGLLVGVLATRCALAIDRSQPAKEFGVVPPTLPSLGLSRSERAVWTATVHAHWVIALGASFVAFGVVLVAVGQPALGAVFAAVGVLTSPLASIQVRADRSGLRIAYGPFHFPVQRFAIDRIEHADAIDVKPLQWGGWGYRGSVKLFRRAAVVLRGGQGIRLTLRGGAQFAITVDDATTGAAVINDAITDASTPIDTP